MLGNVIVRDECIGGGAIYATDSTATIVNNTFVENWVGSGTFPAAGSDKWADVVLSGYGGAIHVTDSTTPLSIMNNIFYDNRAEQGLSVACTAQGQAAISYCDSYIPLQNSQMYSYYARTSDVGTWFTAGSACYYVDPDFSLAGYWFEPSSLFRTAYHGSMGSMVPTQDIDGHPRPGADGYVDIGAYESDGRQ